MVATAPMVCTRVRMQTSTNFGADVSPQGLIDDRAIRAEAMPWPEKVVEQTLVTPAVSMNQNPRTQVEAIN
jgi:hypothetical protein